MDAAHTPRSRAGLVRDIELAEHLGISRAMVQKLRGQGMPSLSVGRARRYDSDACIQWLREQDAA